MADGLAILRLPFQCLPRCASPQEFKSVFRNAMNEELGIAAQSQEQTFHEPTPQDRLRGAIWGQLVGDAFCLGSHWIYNLTELEKSFPGGVQGFEAPLEGHYHFGKQPGEQTHYGDGALVMLESVAERSYRGV